MAGVNAQLQVLFTHVRIDKGHGYNIENVISYKSFKVTKVTDKE